MTFEVLPAGFAATDIVATLHEAGGLTPTTVIRTTQDWSVKVHFETSGPLSNFLPGEWVVSAYVESIGDGPEIKVGSLTIPLTPGPDPVLYDVEIPVTAGTVTLAAGENSTPFKLVTTVTFNWAPGTPGPMAAFNEGPIVQFYKPV